MESREQIFKLLRDAKWIIALSISLALLLAIPDQINELYRIAYSNSIVAYLKNISPLRTIIYEFVRLHVPIFLIALIVWVGAFHIVTETIAGFPTNPTVVGWCCLVAPMGSTPQFQYAFR
jgi:hypothetical protein